MSIGAYYYYAYIRRIFFFNFFRCRALAMISIISVFHAQPDTHYRVRTEYSSSFYLLAYYYYYSISDDDDVRVVSVDLVFNINLRPDSHGRDGARRNKNDK